MFIDCSLSDSLPHDSLQNLPAFILLMLIADSSLLLVFFFWNDTLVIISEIVTSVASPAGLIIVSTPINRRVCFDRQIQCHEIQSLSQKFLLVI